MNDRIYFPVYVLETKTYKVAFGSKYWNKNKTGTTRFKTELEALEYVNNLNKVDIKNWNP